MNKTLTHSMKSYITIFGVFSRMYLQAYRLLPS